MQERFSWLSVFVHKLMEPDVQQNSNDFDIGEGIQSEQYLTKIPRPAKYVASKKKSLKDMERPSSAKTIITLENKFKASMVKYQKELKDMQSQNEKLKSMRENMVKLRDEMQEKGQRDLPLIPDIPPTSIPSFLSPRSPSSNQRNKTKKLQDGSNKLKEFEIDGKTNLDSDVLNLIKAEMPCLEKTLKSLEHALDSAHEKQSGLESNLDHYKDNISNIVNDFENVASIKKNSELLIRELENIKDEFNNERYMYKKEMDMKDEELSKLRGSLEIEFSKRKSVEDDYSRAQVERDQIKEDCKDYIRQIEKMHQMQTPIMNNAGSTQDLAVLNGQLQYEVDDLKTKLSLAQRKMSLLTEENDKSKQEIHKLVIEREEIKNEFISHCQQILFEKENQIYSVKSKMDSIVNLKNTMVSREGRGEPFFNIDLVMNINDAGALKKEVVCLHKKIISFEESKSSLERRLSDKNVRIQGLEEDLVARSQAVIKMEHLVDMMKKRDKENAELLATLDLSTEFSSSHLSIENSEKEDRLKELVKWQEKQRELVAVLERELRTSEERYSFSEERRIRNEERIAMLQLKLAKYQYFR